MANLIIVRGIPGSGKTTFATKYDSSNYHHLEADMYFMRNGVYKFNVKYLKQAHDWCIETTKILLNNDKNVVVSNTFVLASQVDIYAMIAADVGANFTVCRMTNNFQNTHNVPVEIVNRMKHNFQDYPNEIIIGGSRP